MAHKTKVFSVDFNAVVAELLKSLYEDQNTTAEKLESFVVPFVYDFHYNLKLNVSNIRGLVHKLQEVENVHAKHFYLLGTSDELRVYPQQDVDGFEVKIELKHCYSPYEMKVRKSDY